MSESEIRPEESHSGEGPELDGVDVASGRSGTDLPPNVPSASNEGAAQSNGRKSHPDQGSAETATAVETETQTEQAEPEQALAEAQREIAILKDSWTRERAEFQNYKRRQAQEFARIRNHAVADFMGGLLPVLDNLETVLHVDTKNDEVKQFVSGVEMIHKELISVLKRHNIKIVKPQGEPFNPESMEAIASEDSPDVSVVTVTAVFQDGLVMEFEDGQSQVLRPARVRVARPTTETNKDA